MFMVADDQPAAACADVLAHVEGNQAHVTQTAISSESAPEAAKPVGDSVLAVSPGKSLCFPQRKRSQTTSRMSTLKALLTFAALHGACLSGNIHDGNGVRASSSSTQVGAKDQIQGQERRGGSSFGAREGRRPQLERPTDFGPSLFREPHRPRATKDRRAEAINMGRGPHAPDICATSGATRDLSPPLAADVKEVHQSMDPAATEFPTNRKISLIAAENFALRQAEQLRRVREPKALGAKPKDGGYPAKAKNSTASSPPRLAPTSPTTVSGTETQSPNSGRSSVVVSPDTQEEMTAHPEGSSGQRDIDRGAGVLEPILKETETGYHVKLVNGDAVEQLAEELLYRRRFDHGSLDMLLNMMVATWPQPHQETKQNSFAMTFGFYVRGPMVSLRRPMSARKCAVM